MGCNFLIAAISLLIGKESCNRFPYVLVAGWGVQDSTV